MQYNKVWKFVPLFEGVKPIGCKWILKTKTNSKGNMVMYKARLIAKGYTENNEIDFKETLSPVSSKDTFMIIMALVTNLDLELHQMDIKTPFLKGNIDKMIYRVQPEKFVLGDPKKID